MLNGEKLIYEGPKCGMRGDLPRNVVLLQHEARVSGGEGARDNGMEQRLCPVGDEATGEFLSVGSLQTIFLSSVCLHWPSSMTKGRSK